MFNSLHRWVSAEGPWQGKQLLIVEDDVLLQTLFNQTLKKIAPEVWIEWVTTVEEAEARLKERTFDLILSDYSLTGLQTGLDLWETCMKRYPKTPFVIISGLSIPDFIERMRGHKNTPPFLPKPFFPGELKQLVRTYIRA